MIQFPVLFVCLLQLLPFSPEIKTLVLLTDSHVALSILVSRMSMYIKTIS